MKSPSTLRVLILTASLTALAACGGDNAPAADEGGDAAAPGEGSELSAAISQRQDGFEAIGDAFKAIRGELEGGSPDMAVISEAATAMNENAQKVGDLFPAGTSVDDGFETEALAVIWDKPEEFESKHKALLDATAEMVTIAATGDAAAVKAQVGNVGLSCKGCHDTFRLDTD
ncbi:MAG: cytochrome c [Erythrobacter sp.]